MIGGVVADVAQSARSGLLHHSAEELGGERVYGRRGHAHAAQPFGGESHLNRVVRRR